MDIQRVFSALINRIEQLEGVVNQQDRRISNMMREGTVTEVDHAKGVAKADIGGFETKEIPWAQRAGEIKEWNPVSVGERILVVNPTGEVGNGIIMPGGFSKEFGQNHDQGAQYRQTIGSATITSSGDGLVIVAGGVTFTFNGSGFTQDGGAVTHDGKNIGKDHKHKEVMPGGGISGDPV
jgi:hypothetical protein